MFPQCLGNGENVLASVRHYLGFYPYFLHSHTPIPYIRCYRLTSGTNWNCLGRPYAEPWMGEGHSKQISPEGNFETHAR